VTLTHTLTKNDSFQKRKKKKKRTLSLCLIITQNGERERFFIRPKRRPKPHHKALVFPHYQRFSLLIHNTMPFPPPLCHPPPSPPLPPPTPLLLHPPPPPLFHLQPPIQRPSRSSHVYKTGQNRAKKNRGMEPEPEQVLVCNLLIRANVEPFDLFGEAHVLRGSA
jgi:hypothetical protein